MGVLFGLLWLAPHKANGDIPQAVGTSLALLGCSLFVMSVISVRWFRRAERAFIRRRPVPPAAFPAFQALVEAEGRLAAATHRADRALAGWTEAEREEPVLLYRGDGLRTFDVWSTRGRQFHETVTGSIAQEVAIKRRQLDEALRGCFRS